MIKIQRGWIVLPDLYRNFLHNYNIEIATVFSNLLQLKLVFVSDFDPKIISKKDIVFLFSVPSNNCNNDDFNDCKGTVIYWMDDCQFPNEQSYFQIKKILNRADIVFFVSKSIFLDAWSSKCLNSNYYWFPFYASDPFLLSFNQSPNLNCLLYGHCSKMWYPIRNKVKNEGKFKLGDSLKIIDHQGYEKKDFFYTGFNLSKEINKNFCCVTDSGIACNTFLYTNSDHFKFSKEQIDALLPGVIDKSKNYGHVLKKYFEIPATGSLLIADENTPEMQELGFVKDINFISVSKDDVIDVISHCLSEPEKYYTMRKNAQLMIFKNHTIKNRINYAIEIFKKEGFIE